MKGKLASALLTLLILAPLSFATNYYPAQPSITSPSNASTDIATNPRVESSAMLEINQSGSSATGSLIFSSASWRFYERDDSLTFFGGIAGTDATRFDAIPERITTYTVPDTLELMFNGSQIAKLNIYNTGKVDLLSVSDTIIATITAQSDALAQYRPGAGFDVIKTLNNGVLVQWSFQTTAYSNEHTIEVFIANNGNLIVRTSPNALTESLFNSTDSIFSATTESEAISKSLADWKVLLENQSENEFGLVFNINPDNNNLRAQLPAESAITDIQKPAIIEVTADNVMYDTPENTLDPIKEYTGQVQYVAQQAGENRLSELSAPVNFTTALDSNLSVELLNTPSATIGESVRFEFEVTNTGKDAGRPMVEVKLPFNALNKINGTLGDFFKAESSAGTNSTCIINVVSDETFLRCTLDVSADQNSKVYITSTFYDAGTTNIGYRVCETRLDRCNGVDYIPLSITVTNKQTEESTSSESSSGGGSAIWLTLLSLSLLRLRRKS